MRVEKPDGCGGCEGFSVHLTKKRKKVFMIYIQKQENIVSNNTNVYKELQ